MKVFISHSSDDKRFVRTLKTDLNENGIHTWFDEDELNLGDSLIDKLDASIEDTSHFIIVLSESSINSQWVQFEMDKILKKLSKKIIPIKYKDCDVPPNLEHLLFGDVSKIIRIVNNDRLIFRDEAYHKFIEKLCKSLKSDETKLNKTDKKLLTTKELENEDFHVKDKKFLNLHIKGYASTEVRESYSKKITEILTKEQQKRLKIHISKPVILPLIFKQIFSNIQIGDRILFKNKSSEQREGLFAGFRVEDDQVLILPASIRNYLNLERSDKAFDVLVFIPNKEITVL